MERDHGAVPIQLCLAEDKREDRNEQITGSYGKQPALRRDRL